MVEGRLERLKCSHVSTLKVKAHHSSHFSPLFVSGSYVGGASKGQSLHPFHLLYTAQKVPCFKKNGHVALGKSAALYRCTVHKTSGAIPQLQGLWSLRVFQVINIGFCSNFLEINLQKFAGCPTPPSPNQLNIFCRPNEPEASASVLVGVEDPRFVVPCRADVSASLLKTVTMVHPLPVSKSPG